MVWYFIGVYIIKRTLHAAWRYEISLFQYSKRNFVSPRGHVISSIYRIIGISTYSCIAIRDHTPCYWHNLAL